MPARVQTSIEAVGFNIRCQIMWAKPRHVISRGHYHWQHEPCWYAVRKGGTGHWQGSRSQTTRWQIEHLQSTQRDVETLDRLIQVLRDIDPERLETTLWKIEHLRSETGHSTQKPVECMARPIENNSAVRERVYDPFVGSGTTIIAAETTRRACDALELDPGYCDVAVMRWQAFTGERAVRERDGRAFDEVKSGRRAKAA
jgi:DNA modification methylase